MTERFVRASITVAALVLISAAIAHAQRAVPALRGLAEVHLLIEALDKDSTACGITEPQVRSAFMYLVSGARFSVTADPLAVSPVFYINIITSRGEGICASMVETKVYSYQKVKLEYQEYERMSEVLLWSTHIVTFSNSRRHSDEIKSVVEDMTKKFVTVWNLSNK